MRVAAIDVGTNSIHLLVADVSPEGEITVVEKAREQVELGSGGLGVQQITPEAAARGLRALHSFREACASFDVDDIHAAATSAVREASNGVAFCKEVKRATGIHVRIISGTEEARLIYLGARGHLDFSRGRVLVIDLGGGSTEFIVCDAEEALLSMSLPLGHIRLAEAHHRTDPIGVEGVEALRQTIQSKLRPLLQRIRGDDFGSIVGSSGAIRCLARIATLERGDPRPRHAQGIMLHRAELDALVERFTVLTASELAAVPGMDAKRKRTLPAAAVLIQEVMRALEKNRLVTSERSLRDGLVVDWLMRNRPEISMSRAVPDPRRRSVLSVMQRYNVDTDHAYRCATFALQIFDATSDLHLLRIDDRRLLEFAALLHDVGHHIAGEDHHRHGQYLIRHTRMPGFTAPEIAMLSNMVRYHRGRKPKKPHLEYGALPATDRRRVDVLAGILRVADALDRGHAGNVTGLEISVADNIQIVATAQDPAHLERWATVRRADLLEDSLGLPLRVTIRQDEDA